MIALEPPALAVFARVQPVPDAEMAAQRLTPKATIQADDVAVPNGSPLAQASARCAMPDRYGSAGRARAYDRVDFEMMSAGL